jgi:hypothetical protein
MVPPPGGNKSSQNGQMISLGLPVLGILVFEKAVPLDPNVR